MVPPKKKPPRVYSSGVDMNKHPIPDHSITSSTRKSGTSEQSPDKFAPSGAQFEHILAIIAVHALRTSAFALWAN